MQKVREALHPDRDGYFDAAMEALIASHFNLHDSPATFVDPETNESFDDLASLLHGKTGEEVIAVAARVKAAEEASEREWALGKIQELLAARDACEASRPELRKFEVLRARYSPGNDSAGRKPEFHLRVRNGTQHTVSRVYFEGRMTIPGQPEPWAEDELKYEVEGGLEPGEEAEWRVAPKITSRWTILQPPADVDLVVTPTRLDSPDGQPPLSIREFTEQEAAVLASLQRKYGQS
jgi:hypothetical protein